MDDYGRFHSLLRRDFTPLLREGGFKGNGVTFRRIEGDTTRIVNVQGSCYGGRCCVNLGLYYAFLAPVGGGASIAPTKLKEYNCQFRNRLHEANEAARWWNYGMNEQETEASVASLIELYRRRGGAFFAKFESFPDVFERITPEEIAMGGGSNLLPGMPLVYRALTMARIMDHLGNEEQCRQFAEVGLQHLDNGVRPKAELLRFLVQG